MGSSRQERELAVKKSLANGALEGLHPDPAFRSLLDQYIVGTRTLEQALAMTLARYGNAGTES